MIFFGVGNRLHNHTPIYRAGVDAKAASVQPRSEHRMKKPVGNAEEKRTSGTQAVEKYRPKMNELTDAERERLLAQAMVTIYGHEFGGN